MVVNVIQKTLNIPGSKVLSIESVSAHSHEKEILLDKGGQFFITCVEKKYPKTLIHITYLPKLSQPVKINEPTVEEIDKIIRITNLFSKNDTELFDEDELRSQI